MLGASLGRLFQCLTTFFIQKFFLLSSLNLPCCSFAPFLYVLSQDPSEKQWRSYYLKVTGVKVLLVLVEVFPQNTTREQVHRRGTEKAIVFWCLRRYGSANNGFSLNWGSGPRPNSSAGIFTLFSTGLLAHSVFMIIMSFWKTVQSRKVYSCWNCSNSAETEQVGKTETKSCPSLTKPSIELMLQNSLGVCETVLVHPCAKVIKYSLFSCHLHKRIAAYKLSVWCLSRSPTNRQTFIL